ncbi:MAG: epoxide hydrolase family protein [Acidimicrobiia bacterium]
MSIEIRPFVIDVPASVLDDLRDRLARTRWPEPETVDDWSQGIPLSYVQEVCEYWQNSYDWPSRQARLNQLPQFHTTLTGGGDEPLDIHFLHVRSPEPDAFPLILTHGWPGSIVEFTEAIGPLVDPVAHGGNAADAFHVVAPSLPGYGFSAKPTRTGWGVDRVATAWDDLMVRLGYTRYGAQGGDWGSAVTTRIGAQNLGHCAGIHINLVAAFPGPEALADLTDEEQVALGKMAYYDKQDSGYSKQQSTRPQTLGYGLVDSPSGQAAWILEKFWAWTDNNGRPDDAIDLDRLLDNVMLYWLNGAGASSGRLYWESMGAFAGNVVPVPAGASQFPKEIFLSSRRWAERVYTDLRHWNMLDRGGHFAAMEEPDLYVDEIRTFFRGIR